MQLKALSCLSETLQILNKNANITDTFNRLSLSMQRTVLASGKLSAEQLNLIATNNLFTSSINGNETTVSGLTLKEVENAASTASMSTSQVTSTDTTLGLSTAFKGLGIAIKNATISMFTWMATTPIGWATAAVATIGAVIAGFSLYNKKLEEQREKIKETAKEAKLR